METWETLPGETPLDDSSGLKLPDIETRLELYIAEAQSISKVFLKYLASRPSRKLTPFDRPWMLKLHGEMFGDVWDWAGKVRAAELTIGVPPHQIEPMLKDLALDLRAWESGDMSLIEQAATLHHRTSHIHPFLNGNGRWSRVLANIWTFMHGDVHVCWPDEHIAGTNVIREKYITALQAADKGDMGPLIRLHEQYTESVDEM